MDNNKLINIDDLFRQRLGGGEEKEREGAWSRMEELLDKDDRRRPGGFFWRRAFSYVGVVALLAAVSVGGYEYTAFRNLGATPGDGPSGAGTDHNGGISAAAGQPGHSAAVAGSVTGKHNSTDRSAAIAPANQGAAAHGLIAANTVVPAHSDTRDEHTSNNASGNTLKKHVDNANGIDNSAVIAAAPNEVSQHSGAYRHHNTTNTTGTAQSPSLTNVNTVRNAKNVTTTGNVQLTPATAVQPAKQNAIGDAGIATSGSNTLKGNKSGEKSAMQSSTGDNGTVNGPAASGISAAVNSDNSGAAIHQSGIAAATHTAVKHLSHSTSAQPAGDTNGGVTVAAGYHKIHAANSANGLRPIDASNQIASSAAGHVGHHAVHSAKVGAAQQVTTTDGDNGSPDPSHAMLATTSRHHATHSSTLAAGIPATAHSADLPTAGSPSPATTANGANNTHIAKISGHKVHIGASTPATAHVAALPMAGAPTQAATANGVNKTHIAKIGGHTGHVSAPLAANVSKNIPVAANQLHGSAITASSSAVHKTVGKGKADAAVAETNEDNITGSVVSKHTAPVHHATDKKGITAANADVDGTATASVVAPPVRLTHNVQRIVVVQHLVTTNSGDQFMRMDTISVDNVTEDVIAATELADGHPSDLRSVLPKTVLPMPKPIPSTASRASHSNAIASIAPSANLAIENLQAGTTAKKSGLTGVEKMSTMFNDVKYKIQGVQFAPGLTAGINGTFFGPNSFRGFQFGITGTLIVDEEWSLMAEVKYFNRMNNNYAMYDNYVDYNKKDSITNTYSFSTLHSFELPIAVRYSAGRFNVFAGGNFEYALGINTGPDPVATALVNTPAAGQKSAPELKDGDFDSRFCIGYLLGMSFQVSPNVSLDFRSTQNLWDSKQTSGGKIVAQQLYRSPSLQFSIGYRFGSKKNKD